MNEAASMFYMLADKLRRAVKKRPKLSAKELDKYTGVLFKEVSKPRQYLSLPERNR